MSTSQAWNPDDYAQHAGFVPELGKALLSLLPASAERVLDLGCGDGVLTEQLAARHARVVGVDTSTALVERAKQRGLDARLMAGEELRFEDEFDAVFSNAALHWMKDADAALAGVARALKKGGSFVGELGGKGNTDTLLTTVSQLLAAQGIAASALNPWYFPSPAEYATRLERAGFRVHALWHFDRPTRLPTDVVGWLQTFGDAFTRALPEPQRAAFLDAVRAALRPVLADAEGVWTLDYVRLRFVASKL
jgi:trans-aconitate methyltransferase